MRKTVKLLMVLMLTGVLLAALAGPASAQTLVGPDACWNNCGTITL
jgi:predicted secreted Zn-dependent protease